MVPYWSSPESECPCTSRFQPGARPPAWKASNCRQKGWRGPGSRAPSPWGVPYPGGPTACGPCPGPSPLSNVPTRPGGLGLGRESKAGGAPTGPCSLLPKSRSHPPAGPSLRLLWGAAQPGDIVAGLGGGTGPHPRDEVTGLPCPLSLSPSPARRSSSPAPGQGGPLPPLLFLGGLRGSQASLHFQGPPGKHFSILGGKAWPRQPPSQPQPLGSPGPRLPPSGQERRPTHPDLDFGAVWPPGNSSPPVQPGLPWLPRSRGSATLRAERGLGWPLRSANSRAMAVDGVGGLSHTPVPLLACS